MSFDVYVERRWELARYRVWLRERWSDDRSMLLTHDGRRAPVIPNMTADPNDYYCDIPDEAAHALLGALARELGAVEHPEQLRRDFEHVRARHDKLVDNLITMFDGASLAERIRRVR